MAVSESPEGESGVHSLPMVAQDSAMGSKAASVADPVAEEKTMVPCPSSIGHSKHNPRSPSFNVEYALADAMSEQSIGSLAALEFIRAHSFTEFPRSDTSGPSRPPSSHHPTDPPGRPHQPVPLEATAPKAPVEYSSPPTRSPSTSETTALKQLQVYVNSGMSPSSVSWLQVDGWTLAWLAQPSEATPSSSPEIAEPSLVTAHKPLLKHARRVLDSFVQSKWPEESQTSEQPRTPERKTTKFQASIRKVSGQRFMIRDDPRSTGLFIQQSGPQSAWLSRNEIWPGKIIPPSEVEVNLGLLRLLDGKVFGQVDGLPNHPSHPGISLFEESFLRTKSGQWIVSKKIPHHRRHQHSQGQERQRSEAGGEMMVGTTAASSSSTRDLAGGFIEAFLVLPAGFGSLIEADNEMRLLERQSEVLDMTIF
ncbi:hypothetical protein PTTG_28559 [Puccinia triticina 1-1 BBBD Race 1]|uniref:Uncharacterized protein n=1 Tax=Puccinia triticina (isolate 1-1 / race 1 (BBBD)) TaxID=630390 RepID=A0A180GB16_PUCT1|nr:hypothetical protein PTTG_28559 [Puccinia triticina 1-1 BBBD Race 1]